MGDTPVRMRQRISDGQQHVAASRIQRAWRCREARFELRWRRLNHVNNVTQQRRSQAARRIQTFVSDTKRRVIREAMVDLVNDAMMPKPNAGADMPDAEATPLDMDGDAAAAALVIQCAYRSYNARFEHLWRRERRARQRQALAAREMEELGKLNLDLMFNPEVAAG